MRTSNKFEQLRGEWTENAQPSEEEGSGATIIYSYYGWLNRQE